MLSIFATKLFTAEGGRSLKKAIVVGGSNGVGLAVTVNLIKRGYFVEILDVLKPEDTSLVEDAYHYTKINMLDLDCALIEEYAQDKEINLLMITAGIGRVADFEYFHIGEIEKTFKINTVSTIKIIRLFYERIMSAEPFYCGVMGSISGLLSSPMMALYAASKASICRFIESVNIELEIKGFSNRILSVSPGSIKGTRFYGEKNDLTLIDDIASNIVCNLLESKEIYIPDYEEVFKGVLERYHNNPHEYGMQSYLFKQNSGRAVNEKKVKVGYLSGTFDLFHIGHLNLLQRAKEQCDYLIVGVHESGAWKGKETFIPFEERKAIVGSIKYVDKVVKSYEEDKDAWDEFHYDRLFVGSDYKGTDRFNRYEEYFEDKGVEIIYFPYTQGTSSTQLRDILSKNMNSVRSLEE